MNNTGEPDGTISSELEKACADEKIHLLGTVQSHGFLMVVDMASECIVQVSSGIVRYWPGLQDAAALIATPLADWVDGLDASDRLTITSLQAKPTLIPHWTPCFMRADSEPGQPHGLTWECMAHRSGKLAVLEWLPQARDVNEVQRQRQLFSDISKVIAHLRKADRLDSFFQDCLKVLQEFSGFQRVMIYRFLPDGAGEVVAEQTADGYAPRFIGLRFPAGDIPIQARTLYLTNRIRVIADAEAPTDTLVPAVLIDGTVLDQSHCILRGMAPVHLCYLHNMEVRATLTLSIVLEGRLWGLIACHHDQPKVSPYQIREGLRQVCELMTEITNMRIETLFQLETVRQRRSFDNFLKKFQRALAQDVDVSAVLNAWLPEILLKFKANSFGLKMGNFSYVGGPAARAGIPHQVLSEVASRASLSGTTTVMWDDVLTSKNQPLEFLPDAAGLLLVQRYKEDMIFCFVTRQELVKQVRWAGEPVNQMTPQPDGRIRLEPRSSFAEWKQSIRGQSARWERIDAECLKMLLQSLNDAHQLHVNRTLQKDLAGRAHHDPLPGLYNRRSMEDEVAKRLQNGQLDVALMLLDIDHFKSINDTYGHEVGDLVLQQLSLRLRAVIRELDLIARLGGDEFMLLFQLRRPDPALALMFAERLHQSITPKFEINGKQLKMGISLGIAIPPAHGRTVDELLRHADLALYQAKSLGRSRSVVFELAMETDQRDDYLLERDLNDAVEANQLSLVFQPKVDLVSRRVVGLEALVRWNHPTRGQSSPAIFIPIAERSDQIVQIDRWVMRAAIAEQAKWRARGLAMLPVAVNLSIADILPVNLIGYLQQLLSEYQVPATALEVEVTESCFMRQMAQSQEVLLALNQCGIATTLDDFGTGFSSLSYLRQLPLQSLKIDQSFIQAMLGDPNTEKLTQAIVAMGVALNMNIVAEGVETKEQMNWLLAHGCHIGQGYFFSPPVASEDVHQVIERIEVRLAS